jgi:alpha-mannosidase
MPGRLDVSLLRSPEWPFCAVEPNYYEFWDIDGQRDTGRHRFEYSLWPYAGGLEPPELTRAGYAYNAPAFPALPFAVAGDVLATAWKCAEDGDGWILRLQETAGRGTEAAVEFGEARRVAVCDLLERPTAPPERTARFARPLHRHGLLTLRIR